MSSHLSRRRIAQYIAAQLVKGADRAKLLKLTAAYLIMHKQHKHIELLLQDVADVLATDHGVVMAEVISARELSDELKTAIAHFVSGSRGKAKVQLDGTVDPGIIGGVIIKTPGSEFDSSIRTKLNRLRSA